MIWWRKSLAIGANRYNLKFQSRWCWSIIVEALEDSPHIFIIEFRDLVLFGHGVDCNFQVPTNEKTQIKRLYFALSFLRIMEKLAHFRNSVLSIEQSFWYLL